MLIKYPHMFMLTISIGTYTGVWLIWTFGGAGIGGTSSSSSSVLPNGLLLIFFCGSLGCSLGGSS